MTLLLAATLFLATQATLPAAPAPASSSQVPVTAPVPPSTEGDLWLVIYSVLPGQDTEFEAVARLVRDAMRASQDEVRQAQARNLRIHKSAMPNADGKVLYFLQIPALTGDADRSGFDILIESLLPAQATALKNRLTATLDPSNPSGNTYLINVR
ncbi:MAG: hypothetical protein IT182_10875 [Acidobacteria bacterium]|nr:hypothetical protein [Acidobacteriota bacterium]